MIKKKRRRINRVAVSNCYVLVDGELRLDPTKAPKLKASLDRALEEVRRGEVYHFNTSEDLMQWLNEE